MQYSDLGIPPQSNFHEQPKFPPILILAYGEWPVEPGCGVKTEWEGGPLSGVLTALKHPRHMVAEYTFRSGGF